jgi:hypothetical protein
MSNTDEIFRLDNGACEPLLARSMREGLMGKSLEDALQTLLEENPNLIPGKQIAPSSESPPKFVLLRREMPISGWSLDHLFVDQYGVPTLVEAKLMQNPESRREVIGQVIEYAANASDLWSEGRARSHAEDYYRDKNQSLTETLLASFGDDLSIDDFWDTFEENLKEGKIRLIIAGDQIRPRVRRMIEYLNWEMNNVEIYGLDITCYGNDEHSLVIVPRIIGQTQATADRKSERRKTTKWTAELCESTLQSMEPDNIRDRLLTVLHWAIQHDSFMSSQAQALSFSVSNRHGKRQMGFTIEGGGFICLAGMHFNDNTVDRDKFFLGIKEIGLVNPAEVIEEIKDGRYYARTLDQLTDGEFDQLIALLESINCNNSDLI